ncbi:MAG: DMT family transporter [Lachnospiraceae bacterium]
MLLCALVFAIHILVIDHFSPKVDGVKLSCIQFLVCGVLSAIPMFLFEKPELGAICSAWLPILYAGIFSSGVGYTLQVIGQKNMDPTVASLILSLESVISVLAGWVLLNSSSPDGNFWAAWSCLRPSFWPSCRIRNEKEDCLLAGGSLFLTNLRKSSEKS